MLVSPPCHVSDICEDICVRVCVCRPVLFYFKWLYMSVESFCWHSSGHWKCKSVRTQQQEEGQLPHPNGCYGIGLRVLPSPASQSSFSLALTHSFSASASAFASAFASDHVLCSNLIRTVFAFLSASGSPPGSSVLLSPPRLRLLRPPGSVCSAPLIAFVCSLASTFQTDFSQNWVPYKLDYSQQSLVVVAWGSWEVNSQYECKSLDLERNGIIYIVCKQFQFPNNYFFKCFFCLENLENNWLLRGLVSEEIIIFLFMIYKS